MPYLPRKPNLNEGQMLRQIVPKILLLCCSFVFSLAMIESVLRYFHPIYESAADSQLELDVARIYSPRANTRKFRRHPDTHEKHLVIRNSMALRHSREFDRLDKTINIGVFGDSYTDNRHLPVPYSFTEPLDFLLNSGSEPFSVLNFGVSGYGPDQSYLRFTEVSESLDLDHVLYVLCGNDLRNLYENRLFSLDGRGRLVQQTQPPSPWWIRLLSRFHTTYLALDFYQRLAYKTSHDWQQHLAERGAKRARKKRQHSPRADAITKNFLRQQSHSDVDRTLSVFQALMAKWKEDVEIHGAKFWIVLLPTGREDHFAPVLGDGFRIVSLSEQFDQLKANWSWKELRFKNNGHWAEEGNMLAARSLYRVLEQEFGRSRMSEAELEQRLWTYYSAFENGWMPMEIPGTSPSDTLELSAIRDRYLELE
jgi:hypothetical protein